jgi:hypothetical protein
LTVHGCAHGLRGDRDGGERSLSLSSLTCVAARLASTTPAAMTPKAAVLPVPDRARTKRSAPARPKGMAAACRVKWREKRERELSAWLGRAGSRESAFASLPFTCTGDGSRNPASARPSASQLGRRRSAKEEAAGAASAVRGRRRRRTGSEGSASAGAPEGLGASIFSVARGVEREVWRSTLLARLLSWRTGGGAWGGDGGDAAQRVVSLLNCAPLRLGPGAKTFSRSTVFDPLSRTRAHPRARPALHPPSHPADRSKIIHPNPLSGVWRSARV